MSFFQALSADGLNIPTSDIDMTNIATLVSLGDSIMNGSNASTAANQFRVKVQSRYQITDVNLSQGGRGYFAAVQGFNAQQFARPYTLVMDETGLNDVRRSWTTKTRNKIRASVDSILARLAGKASYASGSSSVTRAGGTFTGIDLTPWGGANSGTSIPSDTTATFASATGATWTWTFNTDSFFIAFSASDGSVTRGDVTVHVDGNLVDTITDFESQWDGVSDGTNDNTKGPDTRVYWGFGPGSHTCVVTITSSGEAVIIDRFVELGSPSEVGVYFLIEAPKVVDYAKPGLDQASDAIMTATNRLRIQRLNIFNSRGYRFYYVPIMTTSGGYYDLANVDPTDDVHPLDAGHTQIYDSIVRFMNAPLVQDFFTGSSVSIASHTPDIGGTWVIGAGTITINGSGKLVASVAGECTQDISKSDAAVMTIARVTSGSNAINVVFRYTDTNNYVQFQLLVAGLSSSANVYNRVGGVLTLINTVAITPNLAANVDHRVKVILIGNRMISLVNDIVYNDYTDTGNVNIGANNPTGTKHGLRVSTVSQYDSIVMI